jgi:hypothetical protein
MQIGNAHRQFSRGTRGLALLLAFCLMAAGCITWNKGLEPVSPSYGYLWNAEVDSLNPMLKWKQYEASADVKDIRYQLEVIADDVIVLSRNDIREIFCLVDRKLEPGKKYEWRVRPIWTSDGYNVNIGPWNRKNYVLVTPVLILFIGIGSNYYNFTTPEK